MFEIIHETIATASEIGKTIPRFTEFMGQHPLAGWMWEGIKDLLPTLVAIYAIWENNKSTKKRETQFKRSEYTIEYINHMIDSLEKLSIRTNNIQKIVYELVFSIEDSKREDEIKQLKKEFSINCFSMMDELFVLNDYELSVGDEMGVSFNIELLKKAIGEYQQKMRKILNDYQYKFHGEEVSSLIMKELNDALVEVRTDIFSCIKLLTSRIREEYT